ncbi:hypothetical protein [Halobacillus karajensis]|uniref:hypothetical protein n=1 Tax=Halobacillus karajensis TaxID=195088 RepID=UPI00045CC04B|nr:hypothetical protein [Halobacillus karajensis]CDQ21691.1 hypothetical protein BN982_04100 [Halobacillus karajensis]
MSLKNKLITVTDRDSKKDVEKFICDVPNIRSLRGFLQGTWDFKPYQNCFPRMNKLSDVDGSIELAGHTLHIEFKESKFGMTRGQILKAVRQAKYSNITTIFVIGKTNQPEEILEFSPDNPEGSGYQPCNEEQLIIYLKKWADYAKENDLVDDNRAEWDIVASYC